MSEQQLDDFHQAMRKMRGEVGWLIDMSRAFRAVGNEKMADDLLECAGTVEDCGRVADQTVGAMLSGAVNAAYQSTANMVLAALAMGSHKEADDGTL